MEIRQGYKQTEVGVIPEEWEVKKLGDICKFSKGKGISKSDITEEGIECIRYGELYTTYKENITQIFSRTNLDKENLVLSEKNDIIIPSSGETAIDIAKASCVSKDNVALGGDLNILKSNQNGVFLSYFLNNIAKKQISSFAQGVSVVHLYAEQLKQVKVAIPPLKEQEKIAEILSYYDKAIEQQELLIEKEKKFKKGMMQKIFSQEIRFKDDNGEDYPEWEENKIADIFKITRGYVLAKTDIKEKITDNFIYPVFSSQTLNNGLMGFYNKYLYENSITWTTDGANAGTVKYRTGKFYCTNVCGVLISDIYSNKCIAEILAKEAPKHVSYIGNPKLMNNVMGAIKIIIPISLEEQQKIANFLSDIDNKIELLESKLELLKNEKKGMMQKLLTGEVRV